MDGSQFRLAADERRARHRKTRRVRLDYRRAHRWRRLGSRGLLDTRIAHEIRPDFRCNLERARHALGGVARRTAASRLDLADQVDRATDSLGQLILRQIERLALLLEPEAKGNFGR